MAGGFSLRASSNLPVVNRHGYHKIEVLPQWCHVHLWPNARLILPLNLKLSQWWVFIQFSTVLSLATPCPRASGVGRITSWSTLPKSRRKKTKAKRPKEQHQSLLSHLVHKLVRV